MYWSSASLRGPYGPNVDPLAGVKGVNWIMSDSGEVGVVLSTELKVGIWCKQTVVL